MVPADPTITAAPVIARQNNDQFIGYVQFSGTYYSETCNAGLTWYQAGNYAQCCPATLASCYAPTACVGGSLIYPYPDKSTTRTIACTDNYDNKSYSVCNTAFIFENQNDSSPKTDIVCGASSVNWSYYRSLPASATGAATSAIPTSIPQPASTINNSPSGTSGADNNNGGGGGGGGSKAWIAGAVIGPIVGLALIAALVFFLFRRKNKNKTAPQAGGAAMAPADPSQPPAGVGGYTDAKPQFNNQQPDSYANQGAYTAQQGYAQGPTSPVPGYAQTDAYPNQPGSPPPQQAFSNDVKYGYGGPPAHGAQELGGDTIAGGVPATQHSPAPPAAEMADNSTQNVAPHHPGGAELPSPGPHS